MLCVWQWEVCKYSGHSAGLEVTVLPMALPWNEVGDSLPFDWGTVFHATMVSCNLDALNERRVSFFSDLRWFSGIISLAAQLNVLGEASAIFLEDRLHPTRLEMFAQLFADYCSSRAEIPLQAFLLMCLSLVLVLGNLCAVCLLGFFTILSQQDSPFFVHPFPCHISQV